MINDSFDDGYDDVNLPGTPIHQFSQSPKKNKVSPSKYVRPPEAAASLYKSTQRGIS